MTDDDLNAIASLAYDGRYGTHWQGCETTHPRCAVLKLVDEVRRLRAELEESKLVARVFVATFPDLPEMLGGRHRQPAFELMVDAKRVAQNTGEES